jgi:MFS family permease
MGLIAGLSHNMIIGCLMGSFSVMLASVEQRLHVTRELSSLAGSVTIFGSALIASVVGVLMARYSLRLLLFIGALLSLAGYLVLAFTTSFPLYIGSYALLFGPSMAIGGAVGPATLVTRWFSRNRGLALGLVHLSIVITGMPILCNWVLENYGAQATYLMLAGLIGVTLVPATLLIRDYPPGAEPVSVAAGADGQPASSGSMSVAQLLRQPAFWALALTSSAVITSVMILTFTMIPLAEWMGVDRAHGAVLQASMSFAGMVGSVLFGWVADRIGGARGLALMAFDFGVLMALLLFGLPYAALLLVIALTGLHGAGTIPNLSRALADTFGAENFSRAYGLATAMGVPLTALGLVGMGMVFTETGTYAPAIVGASAFLFAVVPFALFASRRGRTSPA